MGTAPRRLPRVDPFRLLFDAHAPFVARLARSAGVPYADLPDVVQLVFVALHHAMGRGLDTSASIRGWLRAVTFRTARDHLKLARNDREVLATDSIEPADRAPTPEERMEAIDVHRLVDGVLDLLPPELRIVLAMSDIEEMPMREVAEVLEIPEGTGYTRLRAARRTFKEAWNERRASGQAAVLPFALWEAEDLVHAARPMPDLPQEVMDEGWRRLAGSLGSGLAGAGAAGAAGGALAAKAVAVLTAKQAVLGAVAAVMLGAGLHAALRWVLEKPPAPESIVVASTDKAPAAAAPAAPSAAVALSTAAPSATAAAATATAVAARAPDSDVSERKWLESARDAIHRGDLAAARGALAHVKSARFAAEREDLRRLVRMYHDGGT